MVNCESSAFCACAKIFDKHSIELVVGQMCVYCLLDYNLLDIQSEISNQFPAFCLDAQFLCNFLNRFPGKKPSEVLWDTPLFGVNFATTQVFTTQRYEQ